MLDFTGYQAPVPFHRSLTNVILRRIFKGKSVRSFGSTRLLVHVVETYWVNIYSAGFTSLCFYELDYFCYTSVVYQLKVSIHCRHDSVPAIVYLTTLDYRIRL